MQPLELEVMPVARVWLLCLEMDLRRVWTMYASLERERREERNRRDGRLWAKK